MDFGDVRSHLQNNKPINLEFAKELYKLRRKVRVSKYDNEYLPYIMSHVPEDTEIPEMVTNGPYIPMGTQEWMKLIRALPVRYHVGFEYVEHSSHQERIINEGDLIHSISISLLSRHRSNIKLLPFMRNCHTINVERRHRRDNVENKRFVFEKYPQVQQLVYGDGQVFKRCDILSQ